MLDSHPRIAIPYESHFFVPYYRRRHEWGNLDSERERRNLVASILREPYVARWDQEISIADVDLDACTTLENTIACIFRTYARLCGKDLWGDKTPAYISHLDVLNRMFPSCSFIHVIRDGRDVALSLLDQFWGPSDFVNAIRYWNDNAYCARKMLAMLPEHRVMELKFEDLVDEPEKWLRQITDFLGLDFHSAMLDGYRGTARRKVGHRIGAHHTNLSLPPTQSIAYKWKRRLGPADQAIAGEIAGPMFQSLSYPEGTTKSTFKLFRKAYHCMRGSYAWRFNRANSTIEAKAKENSSRLV